MVEFLRDLFLDLYDNFSEVFLNVIVMVIVMVGGLIISWFIKKLLGRLLILFRFDKWAQDVGIANLLQKGGVKTLPSIVLSKIVYWVFIVLFLSFGLNFIGISQFSEYASKISTTLPYIIVSLVIVIIGIIFSNFISRVIFMTCENANIKYGDIIAKGVRIFLIIITFGMVFEYIGIGNMIITISFLIIFGGIVMTLSLALGIGLSNVVGDLIRERLKTRGERKKEGNEGP
ncbi:MAG: hypothetical protein PHU49_12510 [Syntrophorhabdaceae bacterium]|jgi:hypothetical protein|nr:hypothetical protein [Syntrophorhabdaceae bacterium]MDD5244828.1 hypothetical protein [Syntrophorhabdaceae bacterium]